MFMAIRIPNVKQNDAHLPSYVFPSILIIFPTSSCEHHIYKDAYAYLLSDRKIISRRKDALYEGPL